VRPPGAVLPRPVGSATIRARIETATLAEELGALGAHIRGHGFMPLPRTELAAATAEPIDPACAPRRARFESAGVLHGPWRREAQGDPGIAAVRLG